jgi:hypothetical protein
MRSLPENWNPGASLSNTAEIYGLVPAFYEGPADMAGMAPMVREANSSPNEGGLVGDLHGRARASAFGAMLGSRCHSVDP